MNGSRRRSRPPSGILLLLATLALVTVGFWLAGRQRQKPLAPPPPLEIRPESRLAPAPAAPVADEALAPGGELVAAPAARVALVVDDLGRSLADVERLLALEVPLTYALLPYEPRTAAIAERLRAEGAEILCHLPMEGREGADPGPGAIRERQSDARIAELTRAAMAAVPGATGVNNHMGSRITADAAAMRAILGAVARADLYFLDSRTTAESVAFELAREVGIPAAQRDVFLDGDRDPEAIRLELERLFELARSRGAAIGIAHPYAETLALLDEEIPAARAAGIEFVPLSYLLERREPLSD
jgi:uncharacterized protein